MVLAFENQMLLRACVKITCRAGYRVNDDNDCEKVQDKKPVATRDDAKPRDDQRKKIEASPSKPQATGQMICNRAGCRPVNPGCHVEPYQQYKHGTTSTGQPVEVCN
jgi:hypothetical protein